MCTFYLIKKKQLKKVNTNMNIELLNKINTADIYFEV